MRALLERNPVKRAERSTMIAYTLGYIRESRRGQGPASHEDGLPLEAAGPSSRQTAI
jgi:hypothetical protein